MTLNHPDQCKHKHVTEYAYAYNGFIQHSCGDCGKRWDIKNIEQAFSDKSYMRIPCTCDIDKDHCFHHSDKKICGLCDKACPETEIGESIGTISWMCNECSKKKSPLK